MENMQQLPKIVENTFAYVSTGNCTQNWMVDGDDIQDRANAHLSAYYGVEAVIHQRGVHGFALMIGDYVIDLFNTREAADNYLANVSI